MQRRHAPGPRIGNGLYWGLAITTFVISATSLISVEIHGENPHPLWMHSTAILGLVLIVKFGRDTFLSLRRALWTKHPPKRRCTDYSPSKLIQLHNSGYPLSDGQKREVNAFRVEYGHPPPFPEAEEPAPAAVGMRLPTPLHTAPHLHDTFAQMVSQEQTRYVEMMVAAYMAETGIPASEVVLVTQMTVEGAQLTWVSRNSQVAQPAEASEEGEGSSRPSPTSAGAMWKCTHCGHEWFYVGLPEGCPDCAHIECREVAKGW